MKAIIIHAIDWKLLQLNAFNLLGIFSGLTLLQIISVIGVLANLGFTVWKIYKEIKNYKK